MTDTVRQHHSGPRPGLYLWVGPRVQSSFTQRAWTQLRRRSVPQRAQPTDRYISIASLATMEDVECLLPLVIKSLYRVNNLYMWRHKFSLPILDKNFALKMTPSLEVKICTFSLNCNKSCGDRIIFILLYFRNQDYSPRYTIEVCETCSYIYQ